MPPLQMSYGTRAVRSCAVRLAPPCSAYRMRKHDRLGSANTPSTTRQATSRAERVHPGRTRQHQVAAECAFFHKSNTHRKMQAWYGMIDTMTKIRTQPNFKAA